MKKVLIISPYFPPSNAADMHRIRMSLPYFQKFGWEPEVVTVDPIYSDMVKDKLLMESIPNNTKIHYVKAFSKKWTSKLGLGSIALKSLWYYQQYVTRLLKRQHFDLIYFSTTQFPVLILGAYWKRKFDIPYVIDMQDPWHSDYYKDKPKSDRPKKYWFSYRLHKYLEPIAMKSVSGIISVSEKYITNLMYKYPNIKQIPTSVITFGYSDIDLAIAKKLPPILSRSDKLLLSYVGVLGPMMQKSLNIFFDGINKIADFNDRYFLSFKGTSYADPTIANLTALPIALKKGITNIEEDPKRLGMFDTLNYLTSASGLIIFGTDDEGYTSSKLYPYLQSGKPVLGIFHPESNAIQTLETITNANVIKLTDYEDVIHNKILSYLKQIDMNSYQVNQKLLHQFSSLEMTRKQCELFQLATE